MPRKRGGCYCALSPPAAACGERAVLIVQQTRSGEGRGLPLTQSVVLKLGVALSSQAGRGRNDSRLTFSDAAGDVV